MKFSKNQKMGLISFIAIIILVSSFMTLDTSGGFIYQKEADTLTTTGTMNLGTQKTFYLQNTDRNIIHVDGDIFANASGEVTVNLIQKSKYCIYNMQLTSNFLGLVQEYEATSVENGLKFDAKITTPNGNTEKNDISAFEAVLPINLPANPDRLGVIPVLTIKPSDATLGRSNCDDRNSFSIIVLNNNYYTVKRAEYKDKIAQFQSSAWGAGLAIPKLTDLLINPSSYLRYDQPMDATQMLTTSKAQYIENNLGNTLVEITVPYWAYNTVVWQKLPEGKAGNVACSFEDANPGKLTYFHLSFTNVGETSKFWYKFTENDYGTTDGFTTSQIAAGTATNLAIPVTATTQTKDNAKAKVTLTGESGLTAEIYCYGDIVSDVVIPPKPICTPPLVWNGVECSAKNDTMTPAVCMPFIQKSVTSFPTPILGWFGLGSSVTNCVWDYVGIGALILAFGLITFFYGENKDKPDTKKLGTAAMILGVCLIVGMTFFESTVLSYFGGNGILLIIVLIVALYVAIKGII